MPKTRTPKYPYLAATKRQLRLGTLWWCIHHQLMIEPLMEPARTRAAYIRSDKPEHEREVRLQAMRPVRGRLPVTLVRAGAAWAKAQTAESLAVAHYVRVQRRWGISAKTTNALAAANKANIALGHLNAWEAAVRRFRPAIRRLFRKECADVPWNEDGLVFPPELPNIDGNGEPTF
jgi:hypothetical protein